MNMLFIIFIGLIWHTIAMKLSNSFEYLFNPIFIIGGIASAHFTSEFTIWSRKRANGKEKLIYLLPTYYLGITVYWFFSLFLYSPFTIDTYKLLCVYFYISTIMYGIILIPLCYLTRKLVWQIYKKTS